MATPPKYFFTGNPCYNHNFNQFVNLALSKLTTGQVVCPKDPVSKRNIWEQFNAKELRIIAERAGKRKDGKTINSILIELKRRVADDVKPAA